MNAIVDKELDKQETNKNSISEQFYSSLPTRNYSVCETDDLACQSQVLRSNRLQTWNLQNFLKLTTPILHIQDRTEKMLKEKKLWKKRSVEMKRKLGQKL